MKFASTTLIVAFTLCLTMDSTEAQLFRRRGSRNAGSMIPNRVSRGNALQQQHFNSPYNRGGRPLTKIGARWVERKHEQDARVAARTGKPVQEIMEKRIRRIDNFSAAMVGLAGGMSAAAGAISYSPTPITQPGSTFSAPSSAQMQWSAYNSSYSTNPWHAPAVGW